MLLNCTSSSNTAAGRTISPVGWIVSSFLLGRIPLSLLNYACQLRQSSSLIKPHFPSMWCPGCSYSGSPNLLLQGLGRAPTEKNQWKNDHTMFLPLRDPGKLPDHIPEWFIWHWTQKEYWGLQSTKDLTHTMHVMSPTCW